MNNQETIKKLESIKAIGNDAIAACYNESMNAGITLMKKLDEPKKLILPKCAEQWIEGHCAPSDVVNLFIEVTCATDSDGFIDSKWRRSTDFYEWLANDADTLYILCDALRYGYEVEKVPKYIVKIGKLYLKEPLGDTSNSTILTTWDKKRAYPFSSFHMADIHAAKFEGTVEEVAEG